MRSLLDLGPHLQILIPSDVDPICEFWLQRMIRGRKIRLKVWDINNQKVVTECLWNDDWWLHQGFKNRSFKQLLTGKKIGLTHDEVDTAWDTCHDYLINHEIPLEEPEKKDNGEERENISQPLTEDIENNLRDPSFFAKCVRATDSLIVGEVAPRQAIILEGMVAAQNNSRPFGLLLIDQPSMGKSTVMEKIITGLFPPESIDHPTSFSARALDYLTGNYHKRILILDELAGAEEGKAELRQWMSCGRLERWTAPSSDDTERVTQKHCVEGCPVFFACCTKLPRDDQAQLAQRTLVLHLDGSPQQTKRVHEYQARHDMYPEEWSIFDEEKKELELARLSIRHIFFRQQNDSYDVLVPWSKYLVFPFGKVSARRDRQKLIQLVKSSTILHMYQRHRISFGKNKEYLIASRQDFEIAERAYIEFLQPTLMSLDRTSLKIYGLLETDVSADWSVRTLLEMIARDSYHKGLDDVPSERSLREKLKLLCNAGLVFEDDSHRSYRYSVIPLDSGVDCSDDQNTSSSRAVMCAAIRTLPFGQKEMREWLEEFCGNTAECEGVCIVDADDVSIGVEDFSNLDKYHLPQSNSPRNLERSSLNAPSAPKVQDDLRRSNQTDLRSSKPDSELSVSDITGDIHDMDRSSV